MGAWILEPISGSQMQLPNQGSYMAGQRHNPQGRLDTGAAKASELKDDVSSPLKGGDGSTVDGDKSRKRLTFDDPVTDPGTAKLPLVPGGGVEGLTPMYLQIQDN